MRESEDLRNDPRFEYMVGRLVGAAEMMAYYMALHGDEKARGMAQRVGRTVDFFMEKNEGRFMLPNPTEEDTKVISPKRTPNGPT